jgi:hypothetical protein
MLRSARRALVYRDCMVSFLCGWYGWTSMLGGHGSRVQWDVCRRVTPNWSQSVLQTSTPTTADSPMITATHRTVKIESEPTPDSLRSALRLDPPAYQDRTRRAVRSLPGRRTNVRLRCGPATSDRCAERRIADAHQLRPRGADVPHSVGSPSPTAAERSPRGRSRSARCANRASRLTPSPRLATPPKRRS